MSIEVELYKFNNLMSILKSKKYKEYFLKFVILENILNIQIFNDNLNNVNIDFNIPIKYINDEFDINEKIIKVGHFIKCLKRILKYYHKYDIGYEIIISLLNNDMTINYSDRIIILKTENNINLKLKFLNNDYPIVSYTEKHLEYSWHHQLLNSWNNNYKKVRTRIKIVDDKNNIIKIKEKLKENLNLINIINDIFERGNYIESDSEDNISFKNFKEIFISKNNIIIMKHILETLRDDIINTILIIYSFIIKDNKYLPYCVKININNNIIATFKMTDCEFKE